MRYLKSFFSKKEPFTQEEIDEIEDILLAYLDDPIFKDYPFHRIPNDEGFYRFKQEGIINYYWISQYENAGIPPFTKQKVDLNKILVSLHSPRRDKCVDIIEKFKKRLIPYGYRCKIYLDVNATTGSDRLTDYETGNGSFKIIEQDIHITKI